MGNCLGCGLGWCSGPAAHDSQMTPHGIRRASCLCVWFGKTRTFSFLGSLLPSRRTKFSVKKVRNIIFHSFERWIQHMGMASSDWLMCRDQTRCEHPLGLEAENFHFGYSAEIWGHVSFSDGKGQEMSSRAFSVSVTHGEGGHCRTTFRRLPTATTSRVPVAQTSTPVCYAQQKTGWSSGSGLKPTSIPTAKQWYTMQSK